MQTDLFGFVSHETENSGRTPENSGKTVPEIFSDYSQPPELRNARELRKKSGDPRKQRSGSEVAIASSPPAKNSGKQDRLEKEAELRARLERLEYDLQLANNEVVEAHERALPYIQAFNEAHNELARISEKRMEGRVFQYNDVMALYEARRIAGHEKHPHQKRLDDALKWRQSITNEMKAIHQELGI